MKKVLVIENSFFYNKGQIISGKEDKEGVLKEGRLIKKNQYVTLTESLNKVDEERVRDICREILVRMFYKLYTQSPILIK